MTGKKSFPSSDKEEINPQKPMGKKDSPTEKKKIPNSDVPKGPPAQTVSKKSSRKVANIFLMTLLLLISIAIYLYQKGYISQYYPLVKSAVFEKSPLSAVIKNIDSKISTPNEPSQEGSKEVSSPEKELGKPQEKHLIEKRSMAQDTTVTPMPKAVLGESEQAKPIKEEMPSRPSRTPHVPDNQESEKIISLNLLSSLQGKIQDLEEKIQLLSQNMKPLPKENDSSSTKSYVKAFLTLQNLKEAVQQGLPFKAQLDLLQGPFLAKDINMLKEMSLLGVSTLDSLIKNFQDVQRLIEKKESFQKATTFFDKTKIFLSQLIYIEKTTLGKKNSLGSVVSYKTRLKQGGIGSVILDVEALELTHESVSLWLDHAKAYELSHKILADFHQSLMILLD